MIDFRKYAKYYRHQVDYVDDFLKGNTNPLGSLGRDLAEEIHNGQLRDDETPYLTHPYEVVYYLGLLGFDDDLSIPAGFLHDGPEDGRTTNEIVEEKLTKAVSVLVYILTKHKGMNLDELAVHLMGVFEDIRAIFIRYCDRVANMKRSMIGYFHKRRLVRYCDEGEYDYVPMLEGFIAVIEKPDLLNPEYHKLYAQYAKPLRILRSFLKGFIQAGREHIKLMEKNEALESEVRELENKLSELTDYEP